MVDSESGHITHLLLRENLPWDRRHMDIPVSEIERIEENVTWILSGCLCYQQEKIMAVSLDQSCDIMKDNHTLKNDPQRVIRWVQIAREEAERV